MMARGVARVVRSAVAVLSLIGGTAVGADAQGDKKLDVTGSWTFTVTSDAGSGTPTVTLKQQGDSLTGHYSSQFFGEVDFKGTVKGNQIAFSFSVSAQGQSIVVSYAGTVESSDAMKGTVDFGGFGSGTFTAKRQ